MSAPQEQYTVIVHGSGRLERTDAGTFWTEVPALAACMGEGPDPDAAVADTRHAIELWLTYTRGEAPPVHLVTESAL